MSLLPPPPPYSPKGGDESSSSSERGRSDTPATENGATGDLGGTTSLTNGPSHDYSAHEQSCARNSYIMPDQPESSTSAVSPLVLTPLSSPEVYAQQPDSIQVVEPAVKTSSTLYFESRPPSAMRSRSSVTHRLVIPPNTAPDQLHFPQPEHLWLSRDITRLDWRTFTNHLFPSYHDPQINEKRQLKDHESSASFKPSISTDPSRTRKPLPAAKADSAMGKQHQDRDTPSQGSLRPAPEAERRRKIQAVVAEWNEGFFQPRGVIIEGEIMPYSSAPIIEPAEPAGSLRHALSAGPSSRPREEGLSNSQPSARSDDPSMQSNQKRDRGRRRGDAACKRDLERPTNEGTIGSAQASLNSQQPPRRMPEDRSADVGLGGQPSSNPPSSTSPTSAERQQVSILSRLSTTSNRTQSLDSSNVDDLDDADVKELRSAFAKFLLSSRSREETAMTLRELNQELQAQRQQTVKMLKAEMKTRRKEMKALTRQHKEDQRSERKKLKSAEKTRKQDLKTLKQERKDLERRQKMARKEAKIFKKNAKKAVSGKKVASTAPYKGWLETLELNQQDRQESGVASMQASDGVGVGQRAV